MNIFVNILEYITLNTTKEKIEKSRHLIKIHARKKIPTKNLSRFGNLMYFCVVSFLHHNASQ